jgi:cytochrome P450
MFRTLLGRPWKLLPQATYEKTCAMAHSFLDYYVEKALNDQKQGAEGQITSHTSPNKRSLMRSLSLQTDNKAFIRYQVLQGMMAAQDTTSELLTNVFFLLARHKTYWDHLRAEVRGWHEDEIHDVDRLTSSRLISNILNESECTSCDYWTAAY